MWWEHHFKGCGSEAHLWEDCGENSESKSMVRGLMWGVGEHSSQEHSEKTVQGGGCQVSPGLGFF